MGGFNDSVLGGIGNLIRSWIQSVPFVSGSQGWRISKDGTAEFNSVTIRGGVVVTSGSQMFVYSSNPPAVGTLVFSISATPGTDPYGNNYAAGFVNYGGSQIGIVNGTFTILTPFNDILELQWDTINFVLSLNDAIPLNFVVSREMCHLGVDGFVIDAGKITAVKPGTGTTFANPATPEVWNNLALNAGFGAAGGGTSTPGYQSEGTNGGRARLRGRVALTANQVAGATIATLPVGYRPASTQELPGSNNLSGITSGRAPIFISNTGTIQLTVAGTNGNFVELNGMVLELD